MSSQLPKLGMLRPEDPHAANSIVVRYSVPDSIDGQGASSTISLYINGTFKQKLNLSSRWSWSYGTIISPSSNNPADGNPHHYYDESHALVGDIQAGQTVTLQKDADDTADYYVIDLIDLEYVNALAHDAGYTFYVDPGPAPGMNFAYWGPDIKVGVPQPALTLGMGPHANVAAINFSISQTEAAVPVAFIQNALTKFPIPLPLPPIDLLNPPLGLLPPLPRSI